jgi:hypothetical protein
MNSSESHPAGTPTSQARRSRGWAFKIVIVLVVALAGAAGAWAIVSYTGDDSSPTAGAVDTSGTPDGANAAETTPGATTGAKTTGAKTTATKTVVPIGPVGLSAKGLKKLAGAVGQPIYWAGPRKALYELTRTKKGTVYVRYLTGGGTVGSKSPKYLIIATYAYPNALEALQNAEGRKIALRGGGLAVVDQRQPKSVHVAFPGKNIQVEIYDPSPAHAISVAQSGKVRPIPPVPLGAASK